VRRLPSIRLALAAVLVAALAMPSPASGASKKSTPPPADDSESSDDGAPKKKKRKHATSLDDDTPQPSDDDSGKAAPPPRKGSSSSTSDDDSRPPSKAKKASDEGDSPREKAGRDDSADLRDEGEHKKTKTAEEDLEAPGEKDEALAGEDEPGHSIAAELVFGPIFLSNPVKGVTTRGTMGLAVTYGLGRAIFSPEWEFLHNNLFLELSYLATKQTVGTSSVQVGAWTHYLSFEVLFGYPFTPVLLYAKIGPALMIMPVSYDVQGQVSGVTGVKAGLVYGIGGRTNIYIGDHVGFAARIEVIRYRRGYLDDTLLIFGVGIAF
jgi:hypothetical protein